MPRAKRVIYLGDFRDFSTFGSVNIKFAKITARETTDVFIFAKIAVRENKCFYSNLVLNLTACVLFILLAYY